MTKRKPSIQHHTAFKQSYIITMNNGKVMQWTGKAYGFERGQELAEAETRGFCKCEVWASCTYPHTDKTPDGIQELKGADQ